MWNHTDKNAGQIDNIMGLGKRVFGALQPAIQDMGGGSYNNAIMSGISKYEQGRDYDVITIIYRHNYLVYDEQHQKLIYNK